ncbi:EpsG family protein [Flavobacterium cellulosilyticum]|uniref:EpsG family protein n=1 Tax=Flavobacterium cellulosilyticum TaxID=2541731 RepID=A0A4R5CH18_9FLAO|nr:EpsG family protein [Flavobacterium cellulosilyticum]TDD98359.1 EpsG family protein [Flavobacterium cellulosilyticum]
MYIAVLIIIFLLVLIENYNLVSLGKKNYFYFSLGLLFVLHDGLRWNMGTDFQVYLDHFNFPNIKTNKTKNFEILYQKLVEFSRLLSHSYTFFLLLHATIIYSLYITALKKYTKYTILALSFLYVSMVGLLGCNRQLIAVAICFFSIRFIVEKKWWVFLGLMVLAFGFHKTSIVFLVILFLDRKINNKVLMVSLVICILLSISNSVMGIFEIVTQKLLPSLFEQQAKAFLFHNDNFKNSLLGTFFGLMRKGLPICLLIYIKGKGFENRYFNIIFNILVLAFLCYVLFNNNLQFLVGRMIIYFSVFECVVYSWFFMILYNSKEKCTALLLYTVMCIVIFFRSIAIYPELFIPYKSVFSH